MEKKRFKRCLRCNREFLSTKEYCWRCNQYLIRKRLTAERKAKHICYDCGKKVEPVYPTRCSCCNSKSKTQV